jgi:DNA-binding CsgD family transcriptional regulator
MLRRLAYVAHPFIQADSPAEVLDALKATADPAGVTLYGIARPPIDSPRSEQAAKAVGFYPGGVMRDLERDWNGGFLHYGPSLLGRYAVSKNPPPFASVAAMRRLQPSGDDRWIFDLLRDHRVKDSLWCAYGPWLVVYLSDHPLTRGALPYATRIGLNAIGGMAVERLKELGLGAKEGAPPELSARQKTVLLHLADGLTVAEIAERLGLGEASIKTFVARAARKLGAKSQLHAVALALRQRLI